MTTTREGLLDTSAVLLLSAIDDRAARDFGRVAASLRAADRLTVEDGWVYFVHGWSAVVTEVFDVELTPELYAAFDRAASALRPS